MNKRMLKFMAKLYLAGLGFTFAITIIAVNVTLGFVAAMKY